MIGRGHSSGDPNFYLKRPLSKWPNDLNKVEQQENNRNVESHNICLAKYFDRDQTSLNLTKQDMTKHV